MIVTVTLNAAIDRMLAVPNLRLGKTVRGALLASVPAGKGVNVSRYLAALGAGSVATGFVGRRDLRLYEESFRNTPITSMLVETPSPTRINTTILTDAKTGETHIREEGYPVPAELKVRLRDLLWELASAHGPFVIAGSLPPDFSPGEFAEIITGLRSHGAAVLVDTSGVALQAAVAAECEIVSPNEEELFELTGVQAASAASVADAARSLLASVREVAVKRGRKGGVLVARDAAFAGSVEVDDASVRNTVGAGDAFLAGFLVAREAGKPPQDRLASAVAAGGASVLSDIVGSIDLAAYDRLLAQVEVKPVETPRTPKP
jgi:1-phosphofructokinase family hexose kinase